MLWSIAAGPLVNVMLLPVLSAAAFLTAAPAGIEPSDFSRLMVQVWWINLVLLIFNLLPVYPLDGGQILRSLLWFPLGEIRSLQIASVLGLVGAVVLAAVALLLRIMQPIWVAVLAFFLISRAIAGWQYAKALMQEEEANRAARLASTIPHEPINGP